MLDFAECEQLVSRARDGRSKPIDNNTRVEKRNDDTYALRLHATDIATFHRDGRIILNSGGWRTVTTAARLRGYVTSQLYSDHGVWYVDCEPDAKDPKPSWPRRSVLKPFHALDPGPEPEWSSEGCIAGTERVEVVTKEVYLWRDDERREGDLILRELGEGSYLIRRDVKVVTRYVRERWATYPYNAERTEPFEAEGDERKREQCPHCALFERQHEAWDLAMNGERWGRNRQHGYKAMIESLREHGMIVNAYHEPAARQAWQEAYLDDFRRVREGRKAYRAWVERNRVLFEEGMEITPDRYAPRPNKKAIARDKRHRERIEREKKRINKFVADAMDELVTNGLPMPSGGDCWYCAFSHAPQESEPHPGAMSMGDAMPTLMSNGKVETHPNHSHLADHIRERYYVPSMFVNALRERGYPDVGIGIHLGMDIENLTMGGPGSRVSADLVTRDLRHYLYKRLIPTLSRNTKVGVR